MAAVAEEAYGSYRRRHRCFTNSPTLQVQMGSKEALPHKKRTAVSWPRQGFKGLHLLRGAFSHGGIRSCDAGSTRTVRDTDVAGFEAPARFIWKYRTRRWREDEELPQSYGIRMGRQRMYEYGYDTLWGARNGLGDTRMQISSELLDLTFTPVEVALVRDRLQYCW